MTHQEKVQAALRAIQAVFGDTSVPKAETLASLRELKDEVVLLMDAVVSS